MGDELRRRREQLWAELREIEVAMATEAGQPEPLTAWAVHEDQAREVLTLTDHELTIRNVNRDAPLGNSPIGRSALHYLPEAYHDTFTSAARQALSTGKPCRLEYTAPASNGSTDWYSTWVFPLLNNSDGASLALLSTDNTQTRKMERAIDDERSLFEALVAEAPDLIAIIDRDHRIQMINRPDEGRRVEDYLGNKLEDLLPEARREEARNAIAHVFDTGRPGAYVTETGCPSEPDRWFQVRVGPIYHAGSVNRVILVAREITADVHRERELGQERESLRTSEARYRTLVDHAPEAMVILDVDRGHFVDVNKNACGLFGASREVLLERGPRELSPTLQPDGTPSTEAVKRWLDNAIDGGHPIFEWTHQRLDGETFPAEVRLVRLPDASRRLVRGSIIDITARKRAEAERRQMAEELQHAQKVQAIGQLTGGVAHDFNNLLTVMVNSLEMIQLDAEEQAEVQINANQALEAAKRAAGLTQALLAFSRKQPLRPRAVSVNKLVSGLEPLLRRTLGETIAIEAVLGGGLWACEVDPGQLESALLNLALNARDAMPQGGKLTIETANARLDREYARIHDEVEPGQYTMLAVSDSGEGMTEDVMRRAFDPFFTTKDVGRGSGLGLSSVYGFVKQSRGHVKLYSELGEGTTIRIYLPRSAATPAASDDSTPSPPPRTGQGQLVLVVEDDESVRETLLRMLGKLNYQCLTASDAEEALDHLESKGNVELLLTDVVLPGPLNGAKLATLVRERYPHLPIVFMSGYTENAIIHHGRLDPGVELLEKPFNQVQLAQSLARALSADD